MNARLARIARTLYCRDVPPDGKGLRVVRRGRMWILTGLPDGSIALPFGAASTAAEAVAQTEEWIESTRKD